MKRFPPKKMQKKKVMKHLPCKKIQKRKVMKHFPRKKMQTVALGVMVVMGVSI